MSEKIVVTGTGPSGLFTALDLSAKGFNVVLIGDKKHFHTNDLYSFGNLDFIDLEAFLGSTDIRFIEENVEAYRPVEKIVETSEDEITYDTLVVAEKGEIDTPEYGLDYTDNFYKPESREKAIENLEDGKTVVIGGGLEGTKIGAFLQNNGYDTALIDDSTRPLKEESEDVSKRFLNFFNSIDLSFRGGSNVKEITSYGIEFEDGSEIEVENIIWTGDTKAPETVREAFDCGKEGIKVNKGLSASGFDSVYAGGDSCSIEASDFYDKVRQGKIIAENISSDSELLEKYVPEKKRIFELGGYGIFIRNEKAYIHKLLNPFVRLKKLNYRISLKLKAFRA